VGEHKDSWQAILLESEDRSLQTAFIVQGRMFGGPNGDYSGSWEKEIAFGDLESAGSRRLTDQFV
jgi:hypothetical protein